MKTMILKTNYGTLPKYMAQACDEIISPLNELIKQVPTLEITDMFRTFEMQRQTHVDYLNGKRKEFSPNGFGSMHEAGRALFFAPIKNDFKEIAESLGFTYEKNYLEFRGNFQKIFDYYSQESTEAYWHPHQAMSIAAILDAITPRQALDLEKDSMICEKKKTILRNYYDAKAQVILIMMGVNVGRFDGIMKDFILKEMKNISPKFGESFVKHDKQNMLRQLVLEFHRFNAK